MRKSFLRKKIEPFISSWVKFDIRKQLTRQISKNWTQIQKYSGIKFLKNLITFFKIISQLKKKKNNFYAKLQNGLN